MERKPIEDDKVTWEFLPNRDKVDTPIDTRIVFFRKYVEKNVYWPIDNKSYNEWRKKHERGGDFMVYSKPQLYKLKKPIIVKLETVCRAC